jgi:hypothetical protein
MSPDYPYPAMVSNQSWHQFGYHTDYLVNHVTDRIPWLRVTHRMLSVVIPGQKIVEHDDIQDENWMWTRGGPEHDP